MTRFPGPNPPFPASPLISGVRVERYRYHQAVGDMWPLTWASDGHLYAGAGDNRHSPMNVWRVSGTPNPGGINQAHGSGEWVVDLVHDEPVELRAIRRNPSAHGAMGIKPAGLVDLDGLLVLAVQEQNYGTDPAFNRQTNTNGWFITSNDFGQTWDVDATPHDFFTGRVASCHFIQHGQGLGNAKDGYLYAIFPGASDDGHSYWENGDYVLLGRVPVSDLFIRGAWTFFTGISEQGLPRWSSSDADAAPVFSFPLMTGENHMSFNVGLGRYVMGNYSFLDDEGNPRPYHQLTWPLSTERSQLTLFEAENPWGPWSLWHRDDDWGTYGDYQPAFPVNWMFNDGRTMFMVSSGSFDDYNFVVQRLDISVAPARGRSAAPPAT